MVWWPYWQEFEQTPRDGEGKGSLSCCSPWGCKESNMTEWLKNNKRTCKTMFTNSGKSGHHCLVLDLGGKAFSSSAFRITFAMGCHIWPSLSWGSLYGLFWKIFIINGCCQKLFFIYRYNHTFLKILQFVKWYIT